MIIDSFSGDKFCDKSISPPSFHQEGRQELIRLRFNGQSPYSIDHFVLFTVFLST